LDVDNEAVHVLIPDTQVRRGTPEAPCRTEHLEWIGQYIVDTLHDKPNVTIVHIGDHWDMPSLSSYDRGKMASEGRRYSDDIEAGNAGFDLLNAPLERFNARRKANKERQWWPARHFFDGNHEYRVVRAAEDDPKLYGTLRLEDMNVAEHGWIRHPFLEPVFLDGIGYAHYWANPMSGRPYSAAIDTRLRQIGHSFSQGHQQILLYGIRYVAGRSQHGLVAGAAYTHQEPYRGPQGVSHWRGIIVKHQVRSGSYDPMFVSLDYLARRYEGMSLAQFIGDPSL
jgi:hypothetical protein